MNDGEWTMNKKDNVWFIVHRHDETGLFTLAVRQTDIT